MLLNLLNALPVVTGFYRLLTACKHLVKQAELKHIVRHEDEFILLAGIDLVNFRFKEVGIGLLRLAGEI